MHRARLLPLFLVPLGCGGPQVVGDALTACQQHLVDLTVQCRQAPKVAPSGGRATSGAPVVNEISNVDLGKIISSVGFQVRGEQHTVVKFAMPGPQSAIEAQIHNNEGNLRLYATRVTEEPASLALINEWNRTKRYSRAHIDSDGDAVLESDLDIRGGVTIHTIRGFIKIFGISSSAFFTELRKGRST